MSYSRPQSNTECFMEEERAGQENYDMLAERGKGFKDQDRREVLGRHYGAIGLSVQTGHYFQCCTKKLLDVELLGL